MPGPLQVTLLGTGCPPPNPRRRGPATLLQHGGQRLLVDAGSGVAVQLQQAEVRTVELSHVLLTHLHSDHVIDLGHLVLTRWIVGHNVPLTVLGPTGTAAHVERLLALWDWDVAVRRAHMHDREPPRVVVREIGTGVVHQAGGLTVTAFEVEHEPVRPALGFHAEAGGRRVVISGDTRPCAAVVHHARAADLLIHECTEMATTQWVPGSGWPSLEAKIRDLASYHTGPDQVGQVAAEAGVATLALTHLMPGSRPEDLAARAARHFAGRIVVGEDLLKL
jgi:ribonuclease Z